MSGLVPFEHIQREPLALTTTQTQLQVVSCHITNDVATSSFVYIGNFAWFTTNSVAVVSYIATAEPSLLLSILVELYRVCTVEIYPFPTWTQSMEDRKVVVLVSI